MKIAISLALLASVIQLSRAAGYGSGYWGSGSGYGGGYGGWGYGGYGGGFSGYGGYGSNKGVQANVGVSTVVDPSLAYYIPYPVELPQQPNYGGVGGGIGYGGYGGGYGGSNFGGYWWLLLLLVPFLLNRAASG